MPMTPALRYPDFDGYRYSRTSNTWMVDNTIRIDGMLKLKTTRKVTPGKSYAGKAKPQTRTRGKAEFAINGSMFIEDYNLLVNYLVTRARALGVGLFGVSFLLTGSIFERTLGTTLWEIRGARLMNEDIQILDETDDKEIPVDFDLDVMDILKDGISVIDESGPFPTVGAI